MKISVGCLLFILNQSLWAQANPEMEKYFSDKINAVQLSILKNPPILEGSPAFCLQDINFDLNATVSFGITGFLNLSISPEIDFILTPVTVTN